MKLNFNQTFTEIVKEEICFNLIKSNCSKEIVIFSFLKNNAEYNLFDHSIEFITKYLSVIQLFKNFINENPLFKMDILISNQKTLRDQKNNYKIILKLDESTFKKINIDNLKKLQSESEIKGLLIGCFLSGGSINNPQKSYHAEIRFSNEEFKDLIFDNLKKNGLKPKTIFYKNKWILYFKKSSEISDFLKLLNANNSMFCLEDNKIEKDMFNNVQRLINLEVFNLNKTTKAAVEQSKMCEIIKSSIYYKNLTKKEQLYCDIRIKHNRASMQQICNIMNETLPSDKQITKGSLCHIVNKIKLLYKKI